MAVYATVNDPVDGVVIHFEAEDDDALWQKFNDHFRGRRENGYCSIDDYPVDHGLTLDGTSCG
jgi:hypothetical protein